MSNDRPVTMAANIQRIADDLRLDVQQVKDLGANSIAIVVR